MDNVQVIRDGEYEKSKTQAVRPFSERFTVLFVAFVFMTPKILLILVLAIFSILRSLFFLIVPKEMQNLKGRLAVVTGGANGIGREISLELARNRCNVAIIDTDLRAARETEMDCRLQGVKAKAYRADATNYEQMEEVKKQINNDLGVVDTLVNNVGLMPKLSLLGGDYKDIQRVMDVNVLSHFWATRIFLDDMIKQHFGLIVDISSMIAFYATSQAVTYTTSKYACKGFMDAVWQESRHEDWGVKTLTVFPHMCNTRKEIVDYLKMKVGAKTLERVGLLEPYDVGVATVRAIRDGSRYVSVPAYYIGVGKFFSALPTEIQDLIDDWIMPRITSKTNRTEEHNNNTKTASH